ncbi:MAG: biopolymer transporter ExbD [Acidaminococcales bacterium]|jgi:biopolymer transport protein ExbD|nr:biopolymer transporter ExbD [Acidaminococcales bacterium]
MIKLKHGKLAKPPELMISPMIDMIFLLLVFFIFATMYMSEIKTIDLRLPSAQNAKTDAPPSFVVTVKDDGRLFLDDRPAEANEIIALAADAGRRDSKFAVLIRADRETDYRHVVAFLDKLKGGGITRVALATQSGEEK